MTLPTARVFQALNERSEKRNASTVVRWDWVMAMWWGRGRTEQKEWRCAVTYMKQEHLIPTVLPQGEEEASTWAVTHHIRSILADVSGKPDHSRRFGQSYAALRRGNRAASCRYSPPVGFPRKDRGNWGTQPSWKRQRFWKSKVEKLRRSLLSGK